MTTSEEKMREAFDAWLRTTRFDGITGFNRKEDYFEVWQAAALAQPAQGEVQRGSPCEIDCRSTDDCMEAGYPCRNPAQPPAKAIETAVIMKCVEVCDELGEQYLVLADTGPLTPAGKDLHNAMGFGCKNCAQELRALIPQDGRTQLEEFGMKAAKLVYAEFVKYGQTNDIPKLRAIVTNLIGAAK